MNTIKYRYIRDKKRRPHGLIVLDIATGDVGWSYCCQGDTFVKKTARQIAVSRMKKEDISPYEASYEAQIPRVVVTEMEKTRRWHDNRRISKAI